MHTYVYVYAIVCLGIHLQLMGTRAWNHFLAYVIISISILFPYSLHIIDICCLFHTYTHKIVCAALIFSYSYDMRTLQGKYPHIKYKWMYRNWQRNELMQLFKYLANSNVLFLFTYCSVCRYVYVYIYTNIYV